MRKVLPMSRIREMEPYMDAKVLDYIHERLRALRTSI